MRVALPVCAIVAAMLAVAPAPAQGPTRAVVVAERQNGTTVELSRGQRLVVRLQERAGTGYSWALAKPINGPLRMTKAETRRGENIPGAAATQIFTFVPTAGGVGEIELTYRRPWLKDKPPARTYRLRVIVHDTP